MHKHSAAAAVHAQALRQKNEGGPAVKRKALAPLASSAARNARPRLQ